MFVYKGIEKPYDYFPKGNLSVEQLLRQEF